MENLEKLKPLALLLLRCALGIIYVYHGYPKLFTETANWLQWFPKVGFPAWFAYLAGVIEFFGGCLLIVGLFTRLVGLLFTAEMAIAIWKVHLVHGIYSVKDYQFPLALATAALTLATVGAGIISLDQPIFHRKVKARSKG